MKNDLLPLDRSKDIPMPALRKEVKVGKFMRAERVKHLIRGKPVVILRKSEASNIGLRLLGIDILAYKKPGYFGPSYLFTETGNIWCEAAKEPNPAFNCHTFSLGTRIGLTPEDWIEGISTKDTLNQNPMELLLKHYFENETLFDANIPQARFLGSDPDLNDGDIISFTGRLKGVSYIHSGVVKKVAGFNRLLHKFGEGCILVSPFDEVLQYYLDVAQLNLCEPVQKIRIFQ